MSIKIQINSLEALERLIGGDSELEIDIRNSVVQEFAKKHLKALAQNFCFKDQSKINQLIQEEVKKNIGLDYYWGGSVKLTSKIIGEIEYAVEKITKDKISKSASEIANLIDVEKMIENKVSYLIKEKIDAGVKQRLREISEKI